MESTTRSPRPRAISTVALPGAPARFVKLWREPRVLSRRPAMEVASRGASARLATTSTGRAASRRRNATTLESDVCSGTSSPDAEGRLCRAQVNQPPEKVQQGIGIIVLRGHGRGGGVRLERLPRQAGRETRRRAGCPLHRRAQARIGLVARHADLFAVVDERQPGQREEQRRRELAARDCRR